MKKRVFFFIIQLCIISCFFISCKNIEKHNRNTRFSSYQEMINWQLYYNASIGNLQRVKYLLSKGADVNYVYSKFGMRESSLSISIKRRHYEVAKYLISKGADINFVNSGDGSILLMVIIYGNDQLLQLLFKKGVKVNGPDDGGRGNCRGLIYASGGSPDIVKILIEQGAYIESTDEVGYTPLIMAARQGQIEIVKYLLQKGANVNAKNVKGTTALMLAAGAGNLKIVKILIKAGAIINSFDNCDTSVAQNGTGFSSVLDFAKGGIINHNNPVVYNYLRSIGAKTFKELYPRGLPGRRSITY